MKKQIVRFLAMTLIFTMAGCSFETKPKVSEKKNNSGEIAQGNNSNNSGPIKPEDKKKPLIKKTTSGKNYKVSDEGDDDFSNLPDSEINILVKRYIELSKSFPDEDGRREMTELLNTIVGFGSRASSGALPLAKRFADLSKSFPDEADRKEITQILNALGRLGGSAKMASPILTARYKELSESFPDDMEKREITLILQTTARIK